jgi:hypothetical protein
MRDYEGLHTRNETLQHVISHRKPAVRELEKILYRYLRDAYLVVSISDTTMMMMGAGEGKTKALLPLTHLLGRRGKTRAERGDWRC